MKKISYFLFFLSLFTNTLFSQTSDVNEGCVPFEVNFTAPSGNTSFFWDFGNGTSSTLENPSGTFTSAGVYNVALYDQPNGTLVGTVSISAFDPPILEIFANPDNSGCAPFNVNFSYSSNLPPGINILQQQWVFGDGGSESTTSTTVNHTFLSGGTYFVSLEIITDAASCNRTQIFDDFIIVQDAPDPEIETNPSSTQSCTAPFDVTFSPAWTAASSYFWDFGNGMTSNEQNPPLQTYGNGNHTASLTVTDNLGCSSTSQQIISVGSPIPIINIPDTICINIPYEIESGNPPAFYIWDFGQNANPAISGIRNPTVTFLSEGMQTVSLTATTLDQACSSTVTKDIYVEEAVATFTTEPSIHCANPLIITAAADANNGSLYNWVFFYEGIPFTSTSGQTVTQEFNDPSEFYPYSEDSHSLFQTELYIETNAGCKAEADNFSDPDTVALYKANFFETDINGCAPLEVTLTDSSTNKVDVIQWEWFVDDTLIATNTAPDQLVYTFWEPGEYEVYLVVSTNNPDCPGDTSAVHTFTVGSPYDLSNIEANLECTAQAPIELCPKDSTPITIPAGGLVLDGINLSSTLDDVIISDETLYIVDNGCVSQKDLNLNLICDPITMLNGPEVVIECESTCENPFVINVSGMNSISADSYLWDFGDGTTSTLGTVEHTYGSTGDYYLTLTVFNSTVNCPPSTRTILVHIRDIYAELDPVVAFCTADTVWVTFDATASEDVNETCSTGYNWDYVFDDLPPFHTGEPTFTEIFESGISDSLVLITNDVNGCKDTTGIPFRVYGAKLEIGMDDNRICNDQEVVFTNLAVVDTTIANILWEFGDGTTSTEENPSHSYTSPPINNNPYYAVTLTIEDDLGCSYFVRDTLEYYNFNSFIQAGPIACQGQVFAVSATDFTSEGSFLNYEWDFGNGTTASGQSPDVIYNDLGFHTITLTYEEASSGCSRTTSASVNVLSFPEASFTTDNSNSDVLCAPANVFFTNTSEAAATATYFWDFGNGQTSTLKDPATVFEAGEYTVTMIVSNQAGCQDSINRTYTVLDPRGAFTVDKTTICKGEEITFQLLDTSDVGSFIWDFGDGITIADVNPVSHAYNFHPPSGMTVATLILYSEGGFCPFSADTSIFIQEVIADFQRNDGIDTAICLSPYPFTNLSQNADFYEWDFGDGNISTEENPIHQYSQTGTYDVSLYIENNALGCNDVITYTVIVFPNPGTQILGDTICLGEEIEIAIEAYIPTSIYTWSPQELIDTITDSSIFVSPSNNAVFTLFEETESGCLGEDSASVLVILSPDESASFDTTVVMGNIVTLPVIYEDYYIFNWNTEEGLSCTDCSNPTVGPMLEEATYELNVTDIYGCSITDLVFHILVHPETFISMPTTFTPNGDNVNDEIPVFGWGIKELEYYQIFNRWGEKIFETSDINQAWDGTFKGILQNSDVYAFKIKALNWKNEEITKEGFINLVR